MACAAHPHLTFAVTLAVTLALAAAVTLTLAVDVAPQIAECGAECGAASCKIHFSPNKEKPTKQHGRWKALTRSSQRLSD